MLRCAENMKHSEPSSLNRIKARDHAPFNSQPQGAGPSRALTPVLVDCGCHVGASQQQTRSNMIKKLDRIRILMTCQQSTPVLTRRENKAKTSGMGLERWRLPMQIANDSADLFR